VTPAERELRRQLYEHLVEADRLVSELEALVAERGTPAQRRQRLHLVK
jgi:hypothetical protein